MMPFKNAEALPQAQEHPLKRNRTTLQHHLETEKTRAVTLKTNVAVEMPRIARTGPHGKGKLFRSPNKSSRV
jgi:hypothetical protein